MSTKTIIGYIVLFVFISTLIIAESETKSDTLRYSREQYFNLSRRLIGVNDKGRFGGKEKELIIGEEKGVEKGFIKWLYDNNDGYCLEIETESSPLTLSTSEPIKQDYIIKDRDSWKIPYKAKVTMYRDGREVPLEIEITEGQAPEVLYGSQYRRVLQLLHDMLLTNLQYKPFEAIQGQTLKIEYPKKVLYKGFKVMDFAKEVYDVSPGELAVAYEWNGKNTEQIKLSYFIPSLDESTTVCTGSYVYDIHQKCVVQVSKILYSVVLTPPKKLSYQEFLELLNNDKSEGTKEFRYLTVREISK